MKNKTLLDSIKCAINGMIYLLESEKNYKHYIMILAITCIINSAIQASLIEYMILIISAVSVFSAEALNTCIEHIMDKNSKQINSETKIIKDMGSAAVLFTGIGYIICEIIIIIRNI